MQYPLPYWYQFTVSGPTLPDFYWNVKSQEERIKKICEDLWKLIQVYKMLVDAINDHEERIQYLEAKVQELEEKINDLYAKYESLIEQINALNQRVTNVENQITAIDNRLTALEQQVTDLINNLPEQITTIVNEILESQEFLEKLEQIINEIIGGLLENKMDKVPGAVVGNIATYTTGGQVQDSGKSLQDIENDISQIETDISNKVDKASMAAGQMLVSDGSGGIANSGLAFSNRYIESTEEDAQSVSTANPNSLVYVPEEEV